ncbi:cobalamin B12-binding domain-containing protein [Catenulispora yoronensis]|uniref:Cobalamin B12-binding domain-containing protein n=1 Tax=Catenulispora yoronensis TaxID=450799 RepID=A0ABP5G3C8_9ACTN
MPSDLLTGAGPGPDAAAPSRSASASAIATTATTATATAIVTGTASDAHTWNLVFLQLLLEELGHEVANLGPCVPDAELVDACRRTAPSLVVVSSVNGHGVSDGLRVIRRLREQRGLDGTPIVIGGKLGISGADNARHADRLLAAGFDGVFDDAAGLSLFQSYVTALPAGRAS